MKTGTLVFVISFLVLLSCSDETNFGPQLIAKANFDADIRVPLVVRFSAEVNDPEGQPVTCLWNFGDGTTSNEKDPVHVYTRAGNYTAICVVTDDKGERVSQKFSIKVLPREGSFVEEAKLIATCEVVKEYFNNQYDCPPATGHYTAESSIDPDGRIVAYYWEAINSIGKVLGTGDEKEFLFTTNLGGNFDIKLTITDNEGNKATSYCHLFANDDEKSCP